ncbi:hypothetical protein QKT49_gp205 [Acanthamoeba castellanii medusavirus]|uniref:Uncharacterized protein n=1 Tax=Acanthamoeba castellanii medusavirus J1 TaxID=3114988 RepID=A0A3T1CXK4_9VIRU|nr:hypothetical protein QKT49_gp205 [Acanthamoeba castellanii medusavirus]BBI30558.1 hypothetical protein [Acanthamoeba castellanii medusavirus J1]
MTDTKTCASCRTAHPRDALHFNRSKVRKDGFDPYCKQCKSRKAKARTRTNADKHKKSTINRNATKKTCTTCQVEKASTEFTIDRLARDGLNFRCCDCQKVSRDARRTAYRKRNAVGPSDQEKRCYRCNVVKRTSEFTAALHYVDGTENICYECSRNRIHDSFGEQHDRIEECKRGEFCVRCGEDDPRVLEFDHIDPSTKSFEISRRRAYSAPKFFAEVAKTQFLCVNCHSDKTSGSRSRDFGRTPPSHCRLIKYNNERKLRARECIDCHLTVPEDDYDGLKKFHWDHRDRTTKEQTVSAMVGLLFPLGDIAREIEKCDLRCGNCHRRRTADQLGFRPYASNATRMCAVVDWNAVVYTHPKNQSKLALLIADGLIDRYGAEIEESCGGKKMPARRYTTEQGECLRRVDLAARLLARWNEVQVHVSNEINAEL